MFYNIQQAKVRIWKAKRKPFVNVVVNFCALSIIVRALEECDNVKLEIEQAP